MNKTPQLIVVKRDSLVRVMETLRSIDEVRGFDNMDKLCGAVGAIKGILAGALPVTPQEEKQTELPVEEAVASVLDEAVKNGRL